MDRDLRARQGAPEAPPAARGGRFEPGATHPAAASGHAGHGAAQPRPPRTWDRRERPRDHRAPARHPARTRPLSPDPRRPNHFLSYGDLETIPTESPLPQRLADLGLPQRVIDRLPLGEAYPSIVRALLDEPTAPALPSGPGMIITIIGELAGALAVAEDIARILRLDADRILIASESPQVGRHIADPGDAGRQAARLRGGDQPRLVCVDAPAPTELGAAGRGRRCGRTRCGARSTPPASRPTWPGSCGRCRGSTRSRCTRSRRRPTRPARSRWAFRWHCWTGSRPARTDGPRCCAAACSKRSSPVVIASPLVLLVAALLASPAIAELREGRDRPSATRRCGT